MPLGPPVPHPAPSGSSCRPSWPRGVGPPSLHTHLPTRPPPTHLDLLEGDLEAEGLVEVRVQRLLLHRRLLLLESLAVLHQVDLHIGVCTGETATLMGQSPAPAHSPQVRGQGGTVCPMSGTEGCKGQRTPATPAPTQPC